MSSLSRLLYRNFSTSSHPEPTTTTTTIIKSMTRDLFKEKNLERLVEKFKKSSEHERFRCNNTIYEDTVRRLATAKRYEWIEEILEDQKKHKDISKEGFGARIMSLYGKSGMFDNAYKVFDEIPKKTVFSFNTLLAACINAKKFDKVDGFFKELPEKLSIEPDLVSYNTVIKAFCEMGSFDSAILMLDEMEKKDLEPDSITFNTLLSGFYMNGKFVEGDKIWSRMVEKNIIPDIRSYNAKLLGFAMVKRTKNGVKLLEEIRSRGFKPDVFSFNAIIRGFVKEKNLQEAKRWYGNMRKNGCAPDKMTFMTLVPFLCEKGDLGLAYEICEKILKRRFLVDEALLQLVVDGLVKESKIEEAKKIVELGETDSYSRYTLTLPTL